MRILLDEEGLENDFAWSLVYNTFAYTNHTVLPEALEKWDVGLMTHLLPRHMEIIYLINHFFLERMGKKFPGDGDKLQRLSIIEEADHKRVRMANLCIIGSHTVNGVAAIHSELLKTTLFKDFYEIFPHKFQNKTNGVTPRRWIVCCNPELAALYSKHLGNKDWPADLAQIAQLNGKENDADFRKAWADIKMRNKKRLANWVYKNCGVAINENTLFDIQIKRIHEYKRQLMNAFYCIHKYLKLKEMSPSERAKQVPRTVLFGGKAAPGYVQAKRIIKLIGGIQQTVNRDKETKDYLKVVFMPNYNVSACEVIVPASEISQHISTAGTEASGTSNMKFCMNGCLILGTWDGANVEIAKECGEENMFIFGAKVHEVDKLRNKMRNTDPLEYCGSDLRKVFNVIDEGMFGSKEELSQLVDVVRNKSDHYLVCHDFASYCEAQDKVDQAYKNKDEWIKKSIRTALNSAQFSSDRTINQYSDEIWKIEPVEISSPATNALQRVRKNSVPTNLNEMEKTNSKGDLSTF
mmetsp:Transcript_5139/g.4359  ORF Transcript_5139/g.4359 Transcript_5139/m.4359 type:complete len:522 (+) Transcript_5139:1165-2730(+)